jgi:myosin protein heavy chain
MGHLRNQSLTHLTTSALGRSDSARIRSNSARNSTPVGTFAPQFISDDSQEAPRLGGIVEGENDFSGKRYVWLRDPTTAFVRGWVVEDLPEGRILVQCDNGTQQEVEADAVDKVNPAKFDKADDMAELTHLNEPSVIHNLHMRYQADLIYVCGSNRKTWAELTIADLLRPLFGHDKSILSAAHILARVHQHVPREEPRRDKTAYLRYGR